MKQTLCDKCEIVITKVYTLKIGNPNNDYKMPFDLCVGCQIEIKNFIRNKNWRVTRGQNNNKTN